MASEASITGILVPNIAPYREDGTLHEEELRRIVSWLVDKGVSGLYPNGSMGEFIRLSFEERKRVISIVADETGGRLPILAGAAEANLDAVLEMCAHCADLGCRAVSITGPYYYKLSQESIETYFREIAARSPIDIVLYNIPAFSSEISEPVVERLALDCPRIIGTKDSSQDMCRFQRLVHAVKPQRPEFSMLVGWEELLVPTLFMGGDGGTISSAGVVPEVIMEIYRLAREGDWDRARAMQFRLLELFHAMLEAGNFPAGFRLGYEARGFAPGGARFPSSGDEARKLDDYRGRIACILADCGFPEAAEQCRLHGGTCAVPAAGMSREAVEGIVRNVIKSLD